MKGQMEILGLVVIVILFVFGGLIYLYFAVQDNQSQPLAETRQSSEVNQLLNTMMTITPCNITSDSFSEIIVNSCYLFNGNHDYCGNPSCKDYIKGVVRDVMKAYNPSWEYSFTITEPSGAVFITQSTPCTQVKRMSGTTKVVLGNKWLNTTLMVCLK